jgi:hypothetical protein
MLLEKKLDAYLEKYPDESQKEINYAILAIVEDAIEEQVCTRSDLEMMRLKLEYQIKETDAKSSSQAKEAENRFHTQIKDTENKLRSEIKDTENKLRSEIKCVESQLKETESKLRTEIKETEGKLRTEIKDVEINLTRAIGDLHGKIVGTVALGAFIFGSLVGAVQLYMNFKK